MRYANLRRFDCLQGQGIIQPLPANETKRNFGELLHSTQREPVKISEKNMDVVVVLSVRDDEALEAMKSDYIQHCFESGINDLKAAKAVDGKVFMGAL